MKSRGLVSGLLCDQVEALKRESGEYLIPLAEKLITEDHVVGSIGEVLLGKIPGRQSEDEITVFDALGLAVEDVMCEKPWCGNTRAFPYRGRCSTLIF